MTTNARSPLLLAAARVNPLVQAAMHEYDDDFPAAVEAVVTLVAENSRLRDLAVRAVEARGPAPMVVPPPDSMTREEFLSWTSRVRRELSIHGNVNNAILHATNEMRDFWSGSAGGDGR